MLDDDEVEMVEETVEATVEEVRERSDGFVEMDIMTTDGELQTVLITPSQWQEMIDAFDEDAEQHPIDPRFLPS